MQAYFGSTFVDGTGAVVGVGLLRNLATLMTGLTLCGLIACRTIYGGFAESAPASALADSAVKRDSRFPAVTYHHQSAAAVDRRPFPPAGPLAAPRICASALASVLLALWGFVVGTIIGWQAAAALMGLPTETYFLMFCRMIWFRDVVGMLVKGVFFGLVPAAVCCFEALRVRGNLAAEHELSDEGARRDARGDVAVPIVRAVSVSMATILLLNMTWFLLVYHAVPIYGPSLLQPPTP
jgi:phospholipid/cholesterol/gamma-HCH transport system permease protein